MTTTNPSHSGRLDRVLVALDRHPSSWLLIGVALLAASQLRLSIGALAWFAPIPWLRYLRIRDGWRQRLALVAAGLLAWTLALLKIITAPVPSIFAVLFALPIATTLTLPYLSVPRLRRLGEGVAILVFGALMVSGEWLLHAGLEFGTWGSAANTQLEQLGLLQLASVTGLHGVSFLVYLVAGSLESMLASRSRRGVARFAAVAALLLGVVAWGEARLALSTDRGVERSRVAAVGTDSTVGIGPLPDDVELARVEAGLFARTRAAARAGASLVVWTEAATMVWPKDESAFLERVAAVAGAEHVTVVAGYVVPLTVEPLSYENRYALLTPEGQVDHVYDKHHPVPGEPAAAGTAPMPLYESPELGRVSGAICYDYDFPRLGLKHARLDVDLVALPSSDWRGIDPIHTQMAALRAIEGGHSLVRSTRFGLAAAFDPHGRPRAWLSHWDEGDRVMVASVPRHGVTTLYGRLGDWFPISCLVLGSLALLGTAIVSSRWYAARPWATPFSPPPAEPSSTPASGSASTSMPS